MAASAITNLDDVNEYSVEFGVSDVEREPSTDRQDVVFVLVDYGEQIVEKSDDVAGDQEEVSEEAGGFEPGVVDEFLVGQDLVEMGVVEHGEEFVELVSPQDEECELGDEAKVSEEVVGGVYHPFQIPEAEDHVDDE